MGVTWEPSTLGDVADTLVSKRRALVDLQDEIDGGEPPETWVAGSAEDAHAAHQRLRDRLNDMAAEVASVIAGLDGAASQIRSAKEAVRDQLDAAARKGCTVDQQTGRVTPPASEGGEDGGGEEVTQAEVDTIVDGLSRALTQADQADADLASTLLSAGFGTTSGGEGSISEAVSAGTHQEAMQGMSGQERAEYLIEHEEIPPEVLDAILEDDRTTAYALGDIVADQMAGIDHDSSESDVVAVNDLLERFQHSELASAGIVHQAGGRGLMSAVGIAGSRLYAGTGDEATNQRLAELTRAVFRSGEPALEPYVSRQVAEQMVEVMRDPDLRSDQPGNDPVAMSYLLHDSELSTAFLDTMGDELDDFERNDMAEHGATWSGMSSMSYGVSWLFDEEDRMASFDPVASYMTALGKNDEAALQFFQAEGTNPHGASMEDRMEYWVGDRRWSHDQFGGLMSALDAATTGPGNLGPEDLGGDQQAASEIMSYAVHELAGREGMGTEQERFEPGNVSEAGTTHLAHMMTTYMPAIDNAIQDSTNPGEDTLGTEDLTAARYELRDMPSFARSELEAMAQVATSSDQGFETLRHGVSSFQGAMLQESIAENGSIDAETVRSDARLEGFFVNAVGDAAIGEAAEQDARRQAWIDMGSEVVGAVPVPGGGVVEFLAGQAIDAGSDGLSEALTNAESQAVSGANETATASLGARHEAMQGALLSAGVITPQEVAAQLDVPVAQVESWLEQGLDDIERDDRVNVQNALETIAQERGLYEAAEYDQTYRDSFNEYFEASGE